MAPAAFRHPRAFFPGPAKSLLRQKGFAPAEGRAEGQRRGLTGHIGFDVLLPVAESQKGVDAPAPLGVFNDMVKVLETVHRLLANRTEGPVLSSNLHGFLLNFPLISDPSAAEE
jgi:hypothetical protein